MMRVTLRQLQTFTQVARLKSFSKAAEAMYVSQPTVSKQIKLLQEEIGLPLIEQIGKKLYLTGAGQMLFATSEEWLRTWSDFEQQIANFKGLQQGRLSITTVTTAKYFLPKILGLFCQQYPGIDVSLEVLNRDRLLDRLDKNVDDIYVMGVPPDDPNITAEPFLENSLVIIASEHHPLNQQKSIPFEQLAQESFILREKGSGTRMLFENMFTERGVELNVRMELGSNEAIKQAVAGGLGLSFLSRSSVHKDAAQDELCVLDVEGFPVERFWYWVHHKDKAVSLVAQTFVEFMLEHLEVFSSK